MGAREAGCCAAELLGYILVALALLVATRVVRGK